ncbi:MAG: tyrosine-protein phosphatase [Muribaculaceae bacterium]|nr:tyrosine-protein phosphatase [Muribaculaceae bacterium]
MKKLLLSIFIITSCLTWAQDNIEVVNVMNPGLKAYMEDNTYDTKTDFSVSIIDKYLKYGNNLDWPAGKTVSWTLTVPASQVKQICIAVSEYNDYSDAYTFYPSVKDNSYIIRNSTPGHTYYYKVDQINTDNTTTTLTQGKFKAVGQVRMIQARGARNMRDMGGWPSLWGGSIKYGILYRSGNLDRLTDAGRHDLVDNLNIDAELDLRGESKLKFSALGKQAAFRQCSHSGYNVLIKQQKDKLKDDLMWILELLRNEGDSPQGIDWHCAIGCDRCGTVSFLIGGLLGMNETDLGRDYELSCFSGHDRKRVKIKSLISYIKTCGDPGDDLAHCFYKYWEKQVGISRDDLDYFIMRIIDFDAEEAQDYEE